MKRWLVAVIAALCTTGAFRLYSSILIPLTAPRAAPVTLSNNEQTDFQPPLFQRTAQEYFSDVPWTTVASVQWQRGEAAFLFAQQFERDPSGDGRMVEVTPVALLWKDPQNPTAAPYRIVADAAVIQFQNAFLGSALDFANADTGRIVWASLKGSVAIHGPDGLVIKGSNFTFSEEATQLYSDDPIEFQYGPSSQSPARVSGRSSRIVLNLASDTKPVLGEIMPMISGIARLRLQKDIDLQIDYEQKGRPASARIQCAGSFEFDFQNLHAIFTDQVHIEQFDNSGLQSALANLLRCNDLKLQFESLSARNPDEPLISFSRKASSKNSSAKGMLDDIQFHWLRASGRLDPSSGRSETQVHVQSLQSDLTADADEILYNALERTAVLTDPQTVRVQQGLTQFFSPQIRVEQNEHGDLVALESTGTGRLLHRDPRFGAEPLDGSWKGSLHVHSDHQSGLQLIELRDAVEILVPGELGVAANLLKLWVDPVLAQQMQKSSRIPQSSLPVQHVEAYDQVRLISHDLHVKQASAIIVNIVPGGEQQPPGESPVVRTAGAADQNLIPSSSGDPPFEVETEKLTINLVHNPRTSSIDVKSVEGTGVTTISRPAPGTVSISDSPLQGSVSLAGRNLQLKNLGPQRQSLALDATFNAAGEVIRWAELKIGDVTIQGARLEFDRAGNTAGVKGPGRLQVPVNRDLNGAPLDQPATLEVTWRHGMSFNGQLAHFLGETNTSLRDQHENVSTLNCNDMLITLNRQIHFSDQKPDTSNLQISRIHCRENVRIDAYEWTGTALTGKRLANLIEIDINQQTGEIHGQGPGTIQVWSLGNQLRLAPAPAPRANRPAESRKPQWRYTTIRFAGQITGNLNTKQVEFQERIQLLSAPVDNARDIFVMEQLDEATDQAGHAALLICDRLRVTQRPRSSGEGTFLELLAYDVPELEGSVHLEGRSFWGSANELSFDEQSETFVLRGHGQDATLRFMDQTGKWQPPLPARLITFNPYQHKVAIDRTFGVSGGF